MTVLVILAALAWAPPFWALYRLAQRRPALERVPPLATGPRVSVIVPARNEEGNIEAVVRSVLASAYEPFEVIVVDDRSTDRTFGVAERLTVTDHRVRVLRGEEPPAGWYGKPWACVQGARAARGELLCFTDADTRHEPGLMGHTVAALLADDAALLKIGRAHV